jgi:UDP-N-acetylglucosamine--N-acetylmuramyl-(pentapeptide) pyrophosphoryl-undecaprenol N-acetylglucosamine transferase
VRLGITGGGTGGHVYPALEVARLAREQGWELLYLGSIRGQEAAVCEREGIQFQGFPSEPLYSVRTLRGVKAAVNLLKASGLAKKSLKAWQPDVLFSTGGYSAAPVVKAARSLKIPYVLFEANSAPGRSNTMFAREAFAVATLFEEAEAHFPGSTVVRTGLPIRRALREAARHAAPEPATVLVVGGSQGSEFLNKALPRAADILGAGVQWLHVSGRDHVSSVQAAVTGKSNYRVEPYLDADQMAQAYQKATVVVARSGGTVAEIALFGIPSVLVPLPTAAGNHQYYNAKALERLQAATVHQQVDSNPQRLAADIQAWLIDPSRREQARKALSQFDIPDATERILHLVTEAAR